MLLSFDIGIKHLGFAWIDESAPGVVRTGIRTIPSRTNRVSDTIETLRTLMAELDGPLATVLVEKQVHTNPVMRVVQGIVHTFYALTYPDARVLEYSPKSKLHGETCGSYRERKKKAVDLCTRYLDREGSERARAEFRAEKKRDDMSDAILQALHFLDRPVAPVSAPDLPDPFWSDA